MNTYLTWNCSQALDFADSATIASISLTEIGLYRSALSFSPISIQEKTLNIGLNVQRHGNSPIFALSKLGIIGLIIVMAALVLFFVI